MNRAVKKIICAITDILLAPFSLIFLPLLKLVRRLGVENFTIHRKLFLGIGVFPVRDHYYEPQLKYSAEFDAKKKRELPLDFDIPQQLDALKNLQYKEELKTLQISNPGKMGEFYVNNPNFGPGDAELYYLVIRNTKPKKIIEIGSGFSTLLAIEAIRKNKAEGFITELTCIEPYEVGWLAAHTEINLIQQRVETLDPSLFRALQANDILFIDSSHIIRPENDVLFEFMQLLPALNPGVLIHIHDIFSPRHYRQDWLTQLYRFWNEQYLLEAFLYNNKKFKIIYSLNYLKNDYFDTTKEALIHLAPGDEPSSFWVKKLNQ
jgi:predicted O-methyltransferase YrrM